MSNILIGVWILVLGFWNHGLKGNDHFFLMAKIRIIITENIEIIIAAS